MIELIVSVMTCIGVLITAVTAIIGARRLGRIRVSISDTTSTGQRLLKTSNGVVLGTVVDFLGEEDYKFVSKKQILDKFHDQPLTQATMDDIETIVNSRDFRTRM
ncbi:MAG: hypothetical protein OXO49_06290 [Gammaproteobacteria bacterium]|nr:hypothetical protein [Gammaproteobacteria bacterium]MDE0251872.1 hypothetical protein [Gammaproteobacteria bacterium]MDE0403119.1 hypothetical protein [Gammaproteobacteria bacterium]